MGDPSAYVVVSSLTPRDATTTLFFGHLADRAPLRIASSFIGGARRKLFAPRATSALARVLAGASAMVVVRGLFEFDSLAICARWLQVPRYYFVDDNFMVLREDAGVADARWFTDYSVARVRAALAGFAGVLLATPSLVEYFREKGLHDRLTLCPPVAGPVLPRQARSTEAPVTVGFFGGLHRRESFLTCVYPALRMVSREHRVRLVVAGIDSRELDADEALPVESLPYEPSYTDGLRAMAARGIDVLAHPGVHHAHNVYKNAHVLINANAL